MAINGAKNAAIYAAQILAVDNEMVAEKLLTHRQAMAKEVEQKAQRLEDKLNKKEATGHE